MSKYIIASSESWFYKKEKSKDFLKHKFINISDKKDLNMTFIDDINPRFIFFPHWSWKVPKKIFDNYECIAFHTAPLPIGRGGSPIQNLIIDKYKESPVCALKMNHIIDGGPIYLKRNVSLMGSANEIFDRLADVIDQMIIEIVEHNPVPKKQEGEASYFKRRKPSESKLPKEFDQLSDIYDHIRMLDADHYPKAFINHGDFRIEFSNADFEHDMVKADISIKRK